MQLRAKERQDSKKKAAGRPARRSVAHERSMRRRKRATRCRTEKSQPRKRPVPQNTLRVKDVLDRFSKAQMELAAAGVNVLNVANIIAREAVTGFKENLVQDLVKEDLLRDIETLRRISESDVLPPELRLLPEAMLNWLCRHLGISQHLQVGKRFEIPREHIAAYELHGPQPEAGRELVKLEVLSPGWKYGALDLIPPRVTLLCARSCSEEHAL